jgi:hypothetical protein
MFRILTLFCNGILKTLTLTHRSSVRAALIAILKDLLGRKVSFEPTILEIHGQDTSYPEARPPEVMVYAELVKDVLKVLR